MGVVPRGKEKSQSALHAQGALHPAVAAAIGIEGEDDEHGNIGDAQLGSPHHPGSNMMNDVSISNISAHSGHRRSGSRAGRFGEEGYNEETSPLPPSPSHRGRRAPVVEVEAVPMQAERSSMRAPIQTVAEPPLAKAVPVPEDDQPDQCTSGLLYHEMRPLGEAQVVQLRGFGFSNGLIQSLDRLKQQFPLRFWLVDNSGSMLSADGCELRGEFQNPHVVDCTRWAELQGSLGYHASMAGLLGTNTVFHLLNEPEQFNCPQIFSVADPSSTISTAESVKEAKRILANVVPKGFTPLTFHLKLITDSIKSIEATLRNRGQQAVVLIATDGLPTDELGESSEESLQEFQKALKVLQQLPVWTVIRVCTDDPEVVNYYNSLDNQLELAVEVIDDFFHEAKQVTKLNPWLNYAMPLHRCREMGFHTRVFDLLDERVLNKDELVEFLKLIFGSKALRTAPDPHVDWKEFTLFLQELLELERDHYNPVTKKKAPWIDMRQLNRCYSSGGSLKSFFKFGK